MFWKTKKCCEPQKAQVKTTCYQSEKICIEDNIASLVAARLRIEKDLLKINEEQAILAKLEKAGREAMCLTADYCKTR